MTVAVPKMMDEVRRAFPVAAQLLSLRLAETADLPLSAIRAGASALVRLTPSLGAALERTAPMLRQELRSGGIKQVGGLMGRALTRYMMQRNQYLAFPRGWDRRAQVLYIDFLRALASAANCNQMAEDALCQHQARLRALLASREAGVRTTDEPLCADYSPELQLRLLAITPAEILGPILDLGCGENGALVHQLNRLGRKDAWGADVLSETGGPLLRTNWHEAPLVPTTWGAILAHQSFSLHALRAHLHGPEAEAFRHARTYMRVIAALKPGGSFRYAPALPFLEDLLPAERWHVRRFDLPVVAPDGFPFQTACVTALRHGTFEGGLNA